MTKFDPKLLFDDAQGRHHRKSIRLQGYDYTLAGGYFVTIVTYRRECLFGQIVNGEMVLNDWGKIVQWEWLNLPMRFRYVELGASIVMPNHFHGILFIREPVGATRQDVANAPSGSTSLQTVLPDGLGGSPLRHGSVDASSGSASLQTILPDSLGGSPLPPRGPKPASLGAIVSQFKSRVTKRLWKITSLNGTPIWQRNYYEHILRDQADYERTAGYILDNPVNWEKDDENPQPVL